MTRPGEATAQQLVDAFLDSHAWQIVGAGDRAGQDPRDARAELISAVAAALQAREHHLRNLLAVIHRDGGHYATEHGIEMASEEAEAIVLNERDEVAALREALREKSEALETMIRLQFDHKASCPIKTARCDCRVRALAERPQ